MTSPATTRVGAGLATAALTCALAVTPAVAATEPAPAPAPANTLELTVFNINDFHGRIDANTVNFAGTLEEQRDAASGPSLFVSVGDNIGASLFPSAVAQDQPTIEVLNAMGLQTSAAGNHEFDRGFADLTDRVDAEADFPNLGANVYKKGTTEPALPEYDIFDVEGVDVAFIGAVTVETPALVSPSGIDTIDFGDPVEAVNRVAAKLTDGDASNGEADVLVALYHEGAGAGTPDGASLEQEIAAGGAFAEIVEQTSPAVSAILTGHTHKEYAWSAPIPGTDRTRPVVQTGSYGANIGKVVFTIDRATGEVLAHSEENVPRTVTPAADLIATYPRVATVNTIVQNALAAAAEVGNTSIATVSGDITTAFAGGAFENGVWTGGARDDRASESALGNLVAEALRTSLADLPNGAQIGVTNSGGLRAELWDTQAEFGATAVEGLDDGEISFSQANAVLPFNNTMALVTLTGAQFTKLLEQQWQRTPAGEIPSRPYLQLGLSDNVTYTFDASLPEGSRITSVTVDGQPLDPAAEYRIGTLSFLVAGGDNFRALTEGTDKVDTGLLDYEAWMDFLADNSPVAPVYAKHAVQVTGAPAEAAAGTEVSFQVSGLNMTSRGTPEATALEIRLGETVLGTVPVTGGAAEVTASIPAGATEGATALTLATNVAGTVVTVPLTITAGETPAPWAIVNVGTGSVVQGGSLAVTVSSLEPGQQISAVLHSDPITVTGIPAAGEDGTVAFTVDVPADFAPGAHTLVISSEGLEPISIPVTVAEASVTPTPTPTPTTPGTGGGTIAQTGGDFPIGFVSVLAIGTIIAGAVMVLRRRRTAVE